MPQRNYTFQKPEGLLAHYTSAAVAFEHVLPSGQLRMSPYRRMRDPAETPGGPAMVPLETDRNDPVSARSALFVARIKA